VHPDVLVPADFRDLVQTVERTAARGAQRSHHEKRYESVAAVLVDGVAERVAAELVPAVRVQRAEQNAAQQARPLHGRMGQLGRVGDEFRYDVLVGQFRIRLLHRLQRPRFGAQQRYQSRFAGRPL